MSIQTRLAAAAALVLCAAGAQATTTLNFQQGNGGYAGTRDTNLRESDAFGVYGAEQELSIDASDDGGRSQVLLSFDDLFGAAPGQIGDDQSIVSATLTLEITSAGSGIRFHDLLAPWSQASATWQSLGNGIQADGVEAAVTPFLAIGADNSGANVGSGPVMLDVTEALQRQRTDGLHGWALLPFVPNGTNGIDFYSAEGFDLATRPLLSVTVAPVPEAGTLAMMLAGLAGVASRMSRRRA